jgi:ribose transport system permease protein
LSVSTNAGSVSANTGKTLVHSRRLSDEMFITLLVTSVAVVLFLVASMLVPNFFQFLNLLNLVTNNWAVISLGVGVSFLLVSGNFDLSVGGIVALSGVLSVWFVQSTGGVNALSTGLGLPYWLAVLCALGGALAIGGLNALFVVRFRIPSIIVTLGTMMLARGIAQVITQGSQRNTNLPDVFGVLGNLTMFGTSVKLPVVFMALLLIVAIFIERKMVFGRLTYWIGANPVAATLSGIDKARHITYLYLFSSGIAGIVGILLSSEFKSGYSNRGMLMEFDALVIALLGGIAIAGGFGSVMGMFFGALILAVVTSAATGLTLSPDWQYILKAMAVFLAIMTQTWALARRNR